MKLLYFAWLRQRLGTGEETVAPPAGVTDVASLLDWLRGRGPEWQTALADTRAIRVAVNQSFADGATAVRAGDEVAIFPPMTGG
ncbi:MAG: molybdopterin converting factor subunit 1 [Alphaproteobacteria bacterium]